MISGHRDFNPLSPDFVPSIFNHTPSHKRQQRIRAMETFEKRQMRKRKRRGAVFQEMGPTIQLKISEESNASNTSAASDASPQHPYMDPFSGQGSTAPVNVIESTVMENVDTVQCDIGIINGHNEKECQFPSEISTDKAQNTQYSTSSSSTMTDINIDYIKQLELECQSLRNKCHILEAENARLTLSEKSFEQNDAKVKYYTGLPTFHTLMHIFHFISDYLKEQYNMSKFQQFILALMRIRLNLNVQDLSYRFDVSPSTVSRIFNHIIHVCSSHLVPSIVYWPDKEHVRNNLPMIFQNEFPRCVGIIDCFEINIERPSDLGARNKTYSHYKSHNTMKYLIAISPLGFISYISKGWGGRASDKHITENCGILDKILPGDVILADRGFDVSGSLGLRGAEVAIPAFTRGKKQLSMLEVETTRNLAAVRIHVERAIGVARQKYTMLQSTIPISLLQDDVTTGLTTLDKVVRVACGLTNLSASLIPTD